MITCGCFCRVACEDFHQGCQEAKGRHCAHMTWPQLGATCKAGCPAVMNFFMLSSHVTDSSQRSVAATGDSILEAQKMFSNEVKVKGQIAAGLTGEWSHICCLRENALESFEERFPGDLPQQEDAWSQMKSSKCPPG